MINSLGIEKRHRSTLKLEYTVYFLHNNAQSVPDSYKGLITILKLLTKNNLVIILCQAFHSGCEQTICFSIVRIVTYETVSSVWRPSILQGAFCEWDNLLEKEKMVESSH